MSSKDVDVQPHPLVTIVTPVYNGEKYLAQCIESVMAQTYQHWEYVIVDNCSTDDTPHIAHSYAQHEPRLRIVQNHVCVDMAENHNIGLRHMACHSKYCKIVHADDWIFPTCLAEMVQLAEAHPEVGMVGAYGLKGARVAWDGLSYPSTVVSGREICRRTLLGGFFVFGSPTSVLFRSDLVRKRQAFYNGHPFRVQFMDQEACYEVLQESDFGFVHQVLTFSRDHDESATASYGRMRLHTDLIPQLHILTKFGPLYLTSAEYQKRLQQLMGRYYIFLGKNIFHFRHKNYRDYHQERINHMGYPLSPLKLARGSFVALLQASCAPQRVAATALKKFLRVVSP